MSVLVGHEWYKNTNEHLYATKSYMFLPDATELAGAIIDGSPGSYSTMYNNEGWLGRAQYDLDSKYFVSASFRRDASSRFHPDHRWGNFWSAGVAYLISKEDWFTAQWVDLLKIKVSYGEQGNDNIGDFRYIDTYDLVNADGTPSVTPRAKGNETITWEKGGNFNAGVEFELFNTRLMGSFEGFYRKTSDMLMYFPLPASSGFMGYYDNIGDMTNAGIEVELQGDVIRTRDFRWTINANLTWYKNRISYLPEERKGNTIDGISGYSNGDTFYGEGAPMYTFMMKKYAGVNPENGMAMYYRNVLDKDGNPTGEVVTTHDYSAASQYLCGTALAPVYGGFGTSLEYKGFDLSVAFNYQIGGQVYDGAYASMMSSPASSASGGNLHVDLYKSWTPENPNNTIPPLPGNRPVQRSQERPLPHRCLLPLAGQHQLRLHTAFRPCQENETQPCPRVLRSRQHLGVEQTPGPRSPPVLHRLFQQHLPRSHPHSLRRSYRFILKRAISNESII